MRMSKYRFSKKVSLPLVVIPIFLFLNSCKEICPVLEFCAIYNHSDTLSYCNEHYTVKACNGISCEDLEEGELVVTCDSVGEDWIGKCEWINPSPDVGRTVQYIAIPDCDTNCISANKETCESLDGTWSQP